MGFLRIWLWLVVAATLALAQTAGFAAISKPSNLEDVPAGSTYKIVWTPGDATGKVSISLIGGATPATLSPVGDIASSIDVTAGSYSWAVPSDQGSMEIYGIKITSEADTATFQYSFPFHIKSDGSAKTTSSGGATSTKSSNAKSTTSNSNSSSKSMTTSTRSSKSGSSSTATESDESSTASETDPTRQTAPAPTSTNDLMVETPPASAPQLGTGTVVGIAIGAAVILAIVGAVAFYITRSWQTAAKIDKQEYSSLMESR